MPAAMTRDQIIDAALQQAGNTGLTTLAQTWLNNILDRLAEDHKWPFQEKSASGSISQGATSTNLPSDYSDVWNEYGLKLVDSDGKVITLKLRDADFFDLIIDPDVQGQPEFAVVNLNTKTWRSYPLPDKSYTWQLRYKYKPARLSSNVAPDFPNDQLLIDAVYTMALRYEDDDRAPSDLGFLNELVRRYKKGLNKSVTRGNVLELSPEVFSKPWPLR